MPKSQGARGRARSPRLRLDWAMGQRVPWGIGPFRLRSCGPIGPARRRAFTPRTKRGAPSPREVRRRAASTGRRRRQRRTCARPSFRWRRWCGKRALCPPQSPLPSAPCPRRSPTRALSFARCPLTSPTRAPSSSRCPRTRRKTRPSERRCRMIGGWRAEKTWPIARRTRRGRRFAEGRGGRFARGRRWPPLFLHPRAWHRAHDDPCHRGSRALAASSVARINALSVPRPRGSSLGLSTTRRERASHRAHSGMVQRPAKVQ